MFVLLLGPYKFEWKGSETSELWAGAECKQNSNGRYNFNWSRTHWGESLCIR